MRFIHVRLAVLSGESWNTVARVAVDAVDTSSFVPVRIDEPFVHFVLAIPTGCSRLTPALIASNTILALTSIKARIRTH